MFAGVEFEPNAIIHALFVFVLTSVTAGALWGFGIGWLLPSDLRRTTVTGALVWGITLVGGVILFSFRPAACFSQYHRLATSLSHLST